MINFNKPPYVGGELDNIKQAVENLKICGDGPFTKNVMRGWRNVSMLRRCF